MSEHTVSTATARDGTRLSYRLVKGTGQGRVVLVHSLAMDKSFWEPTVAALEGFADALILDCRGHGASDKPAGPYSVELFADDIADLMDHVGWSDAVVAGASMGGCVSLAFAARYPQRVAALGLFDTTAWYGADAPKAWKERADKALAEGMAALVGFQKTRWFSDGFREANPDVVEKAVGVFLKSEPSAYVETCLMLGNADIRPALPGFAFPCRIAVGSEDYATPPEMARYMAQHIPGASMFILEGVRHFTPLEIPAVIAGHLKELVTASQAARR